jgi:acyl-coenzyme A thioesterase PaaI-like protein
MSDGFEATEAGRGVTRYVRAALREAGGGRVVGRVPVLPYLSGPHGGMRAGAVFTTLDYVGGLCAGLAALPDGWVVSTNLAARVVQPRHAGPLRVDAAVLRRGRHRVVTAVRCTDEGASGALVADGVLTSSILVPENGPPAWERPLVLEPGPPPEDPPPIREWLGLRVVDAQTVEIDLAAELRNPWGILHGGVVATLVDLAAEHVSGDPVADVALHFLAPNRAGPVRATARLAGRRSDGGCCRVEVRDVGADRVTAVAIVTTRA